MGNLFGAFADGALLFPLLAALVMKTGMNGTALLATAGTVYLFSGFVFRVPMSVQPLKSVVVAALAIGATETEVSISGFIVGLLCLVLSFCNADKLAKLVPRHLVHGLQMALGILLMTKGFESGMSGNGYIQIIFIILVFAVIGLTRYLDKPFIGWIGTAGIFSGMIATLYTQPVLKEVTDFSEQIRLNVLIALILPQMALTLANSVIGTSDVAERYFGDRAWRVTPVRLLRSIGLGNMLLAPLGGLPYCHGAGGLTAHVKGGAKSWHMNLIIGGVLLLLALVSAVFPYSVIPAYPKLLMGLLLAAVGWFHFLLIEPSWQRTELRSIILLIALTALVTQNMLWVLAVGVISECLRHVKTINDGVKRK